MAKQSEEGWINTFEQNRARLTGIAYRILGSYSEAEDIVQDTWLAWREADHLAITNPAAWFVTVCTRKSIDTHRSARLSRVNYVGAWLPEPVENAYLSGNSQESDLLEAATLAFLVVIENLSPKERAAYILREVFGLSYAELSETLDSPEANCRKLVSRARQNLHGVNRVEPPNPKEQNAAVTAFQEAIHTGNTDRLAQMFSEDIVLAADGGGIPPTILRPISGRENVLKFINRVLCKAWTSGTLKPADLNGQKALLLIENGAPSAAVFFDIQSPGKVQNLYIMRNPDKLNHVLPKEQ